MASTKRERELARMRAQRQAARRAAAAEERRKRRNTILAGLSALAVAAVIVVIAIATNGGGKDSVTAQPSSSAGACSYAAAGQASKKVSGLPSNDGPEKKADTKVVLTTSRGEIDLTLDGAKAPCTTNSFTFLAAQKYFDGTSCHRLTTSGIFVLQCGDPTAKGTGGPGYQFADENLGAFDTPSCSAEANAAEPCQVVYPRGTIAMANSGPGTNGSQFFLVYKDSPLAPAYTPFGTITKGLDLLDAVAKGGSDGPAGDGKPKLPVTITTATVQG